MHSSMNRNEAYLIIGLLLSMSQIALGQNRTTDQQEFFETRIRPVLVEQCYSCHNSTETAEADVALDSRDGIRSASSQGTIVVPGDVKQSVLLKVIRHEIDGLEMPPDGPRLSDATIADFRKWIEMNAPDPRDQPPSETELAENTSWDAKFERRKQWWSLQPLQQVSPPAGNAKHPIDRFLDQKLSQEGLEPAVAADRRTVLRRLSYVLTGLPPTPAEMHEFIADSRDDAFELQVQRLLASDRFGERWARHWMDWVRYADSHGSEGDPAIPHAYRYRDYLIRALNADVPYDQLLREHVAGDLLTEPRINADLELNESAIGPAHWRMVFHGFAPTDALDEKVRFTDDMINVFSKAFQGLTVSCARCHDHKFDAISQADYYALFGVLASCRPALIDVNTPEKKETNKGDLTELKQQLREQLAEYWIDSVEQITSSLIVPPEGDDLRPLQQLIKDCLSEEASLGDSWADWKGRLVAESDAALENEKKNLIDWDLTTREASDSWFAYGNGLPSGGVLPAGDLMIVDMEGDEPQIRILPAGIHANTLSTKHSAVFTSPRIMLEEECDVWLLIQGNGKSTVRYAVQNYPRNGTVYPISVINNDQWHWKRFNVKYWQGDEIHLELATARDAPLQVRNSDRSWFGIRRAVLRPFGSAPPTNQTLAELLPLLGSNDSPQTVEDLQRYLSTTLEVLLSNWRSAKLSDEEALFLDGLIQAGQLPREYPNEIRNLFQRYRELEAEVPLPQRVPGLAEADAFDQPLYERGNHRKALKPIPRRYLSAIDATNYETAQSGRIELAANLVDPKNPLTARVIVNRLWHYAYGQGLVRTPDNFGRLGEIPSHPELLDFLANQFMNDGWSIKQMLAFMLTAEGWRRSSGASELAEQTDPDNRFLSHAHVLRLDAESIRDSLLSTAGMIDFAMFGPAVNANSDSNRRSVYVACRRNSLDQFLSTFDAPVPFATKGRRDITNVPAQALTMMNSEVVTRIANHWADKALSDNAAQQPAQAIQSMFERALGRQATPGELQAFVDYLAAQQKQADEIRTQRAAPDGQAENLGDPPSEHDMWRGIALAIFNLKEFIYLD